MPFIQSVIINQYFTNLISKIQSREKDQSNYMYMLICYYLCPILIFQTLPKINRKIGGRGPIELEMFESKTVKVIKGL